MFNVDDREEGKSSPFRCIWRWEAGLSAFWPRLVSLSLKSTSLKTGKVFERSNTSQFTYIYIYICVCVCVVYTYVGRVAQSL